jgi:hypothetical protein
MTIRIDSSSDVSYFPQHLFRTTVQESVSRLVSHVLISIKCAISESKLVQESTCPISGAMVVGSWMTHNSHCGCYAELDICRIQKHKNARGQLQQSEYERLQQREYFKNNFSNIIFYNSSEYFLRLSIVVSTKRAIRCSMSPIREKAHKSWSDLHISE